MHKAIISLEKWDRVQAMLQDSVGRERDQISTTEPSPLAGKLFERSGERLTPSHAVKGGRRYRYYISNCLIQDTKNPAGIRIILQNTGVTQRPVDKSLLRSIARGYAWRHEIISGPIASASEIAKRERVTTSFVSRLIDLSFLAPSILTAIADGTSPIELTANKLRSLGAIPLDWQSQRTVLGFNN